MLDKFKSKDRKEMEEYLGKDNPWGSYNHVFGAMETFLSIVGIFMTTIAVVSCIATLGVTPLSILISVIIVAFLIFIIYTLKTN